MKKTNIKALSILAVLAILCSGTETKAATQSVTANIAFDSPLTLTKVSDINFGTVKAGTADTYTINTSGTVSHAGSGQEISGTPAAGNITIAGSSTQTINISAGSYTANGGVTPSNAKCKYNGGSEATCNSLTAQAAPAGGKTLLVGVDAAVDGTQTAGATAAPTFTVTVVYN